MIYAVITMQDGDKTFTELSTLEEITHQLQNYEQPITNTIIGQSMHIRSIKGGFQIQLKNNKINTFFAYFRTPKMGEYQGVLRANIHNGWTIKGAVMYLGQPGTKSSKMIQIIYPHLGIGLVFQGTWQRQDSQIDYVYLFERQNKHICAACAKQFIQSEEKFQLLSDNKDKINRCRCGIVQYCSNKCIKHHYGHHLVFCQEGLPIELTNN